jgi:hypothetical protein
MTNQSIKWVSIPYFPFDAKYLMLMFAIFFVSISGTSVSKFEAFALSFIAYSTAVLLDRIQNTWTSMKRIIQIEEDNDDT